MGLPTLPATTATSEASAFPEAALPTAKPFLTTVTFEGSKWNLESIEVNRQTFSFFKRKQEQAEQNKTPPGKYTNGSEGNIFDISKTLPKGKWSLEEQRALP